jgi:pantothenate kinase
MTSLSAMPLLVDIRDSDSKLGMDIGGTLAKMVIAMPDDIPQDVENKAKMDAAKRLQRLPSYFGESGRCPPELSFKTKINNKNWTLQFLRGSTQRLVPLLSKKEGLKNIPVDLRGPPRQVVAAGGGAHKFKDLFLSSMWIELVALKVPKTMLAHEI